MVVSLPLRVSWLHRERDRVLRMHVLLGDELGIAASGGPVRWYSARPVAARRGVRTLMLRYDGADETFGFCVPGSAELASQIERARRAARPSVAGWKWGPLLGKFSYLVEKAEPAMDVTRLAAEPFTHARRFAHPDPLVDRLLVRDRLREAALLEREFERALASELPEQRLSS